MSIQALFPSLVYTAALKATGARAFNRELLKEAQQIRAADQAGQRWSVRRYPGATPRMDPCVIYTRCPPPLPP